MEDSDLKFHPISNNLIELINLKYGVFLNMINELNSIAEYFIDDDGCRSEFHVAKGSDLTFLWKLTVRIECLKTKEENDQKIVKSKRLFRLNQFHNIYHHIKQQSEALKVFQNTPLNDVDTLSPSSSNKCATMTESKLFDTIQSMSFHESDLKDEEICCICMDARANMILSCTHNYCEKCIKEWRVTSNTCPICRAKNGENDAFVLADKPDYFVLQEDLSKSLFQITEPNKQSRQYSKLFVDNDRATTTSDTESD